MRTLYPEIHPYSQRLLDVGDGHRLHVEECGSPGGIPVLCLHGGPGAGCDDFQRRFFDPDRYRIILFDQRGCGRSVPHGSLTANTTAHLLADIEAIREALRVERWLLFGGSWGATLALLYAQRWSQRVAGLILRGTFLCRRRDIDWLYGGGAGRFFPDHWQQFLDYLPAAERERPIEGYYHRLTGDNDLERMAAAKRWCQWEAHCSTLDPSEALLGHLSEPYVAGALAAIESHYLRAGGFIEENEILDRADRLEGIPVVLVHGRYDMVCPLEQSWILYRALPDAELHVVRDAGHSATEAGIMDALIKATDRFAQRLA